MHEEFELLSHEYLYQMSEPAIALGLLVLLLLVTEAGFRRGRAAGSSLSDSTKSQLSTLQGAMMGLLALLLGFSFAMAEGRFETRRQLVVEESNAIGSTYLRSRMLGEPFKAEVAKLLREYVDARIEYFEEEVNPDRVKDAIDKSEDLQKQVWSQAIAAVAKNPSAVPTGLFVTSLNEVIDLHAQRDAARVDHVPEIVLLLLFFVAAGSMALVGYGCGIGNRRNLQHTVAVSLIVSFVILVIMDLDRPRRGVIRVSQESMVALRASLQ